MLAGLALLGDLQYLAMTTSSQPRTETWSIRRLVVWATDDFRNRGFDSPRLDAELLLGHALGKTRIEIILDGDRPLDKSELDRFRELVKRRRTGEPTAYLLGTREFYGTAFEVDSNVLIPRPDTETLVEVALERTKDRGEPGLAVDLCTGSGCVAIAFALARGEWAVHGVDLSPTAIEVARRNAERAKLTTGIEFRVSDLFASLPDGLRFDLITANPPYIPTDVIPTLDLGIRGFEPHLALDGGVDGLTLTRRLIAEAPRWLEPGGVLAFEIGYDQGPAALELMTAAGFVELRVNRDYGGMDRVVSGHLP
ncbi:MAG TPA: peptide chain release factor N(5)-glutamine methyltransferase [Polyangiaceae bacterium]|nr:peptide chain release factor N(5)-glutamine methyltransferase [Polyangiaceae bacterium]